MLEPLEMRKDILYNIIVLLIFSFPLLWRSVSAVMAEKCAGKPLRTEVLYVAVKGDCERQLCWNDRRL